MKTQTEFILIDCENCNSKGWNWVKESGWFEMERCSDCAGYTYIEYETTPQLYNLTRYFMRNNTEHHLKLIESLKNKIKSWKI